MPPLQLNGVILLAAPSTRSQTYIQIMAASGLLPEKVILMGDAKANTSDITVRHTSYNDLFLPNPDESIFDTCELAGIDLICIAENNVNAPTTHQLIATLAPDMIIYSGHGGQIVSEQTLKLGPKFLHMHSGWLPQYRGSTTLYYALLQGELPAVSAIMLNRAIDEGPIVARRHYPRPPRGMDLDRIYDSAIRADLLIRVLKNYKQSGSLPTIEEQYSAEETPFYVIHPILKHLSILSVEK